MKKRVSFVLISLLIVILFANLIISQDNPNPTPNSNNSPEIDIFKQGVTNVQKDLSKSGINQTQLDPTIHTNPGLDFITFITIGITSKDAIQRSSLIILIATWIIFFMIISQILTLTSFFPGEYKPYIGGFIIMTILSMSGVIKSFGLFFYNLSGIFTFVEKIPFLALAISVFVIILLYIGMKSILKVIKSSLTLDKAETAGNMAAAGLKEAKTFYRTSTEED